MKIEVADQYAVDALMFEFGPLHDQRYEIEKILLDLPLKTGDILYRASNALGPLNIPFSRIVADLTDSPYSHAAIALIVNNTPFVLEINDQGTLLYRMIDWLDTCYTSEFSVYRLKDRVDELKPEFEKQIKKILMDDPDYDFKFADPNKYYCTECVASIYEKIGVKLWEPMLIKDVVSPTMYWLLKVGNFAIGLFSDQCSLPFNEKMYFVGNEKKGMASSPLTYCVLHYKG